MLVQGRPSRMAFAICRARGSSAILEHAGELVELDAFEPGARIDGRVGIHPHVDRSVELEGEPAFGDVELRRADAEVEQDAVERTALAIQHIAEAPADERCAVAERRESLARGIERSGIAIDADERSVRRRPFEDRFRVSAVADGSVEDACTGAQRERIEHAREEDGDVIHITLLPARTIPRRPA